MKHNTGDCSGCMKTDVRITYRYTNPSKCLCISCDGLRKNEQSRLRNAIRLATSKKETARNRSSIPSANKREKQVRPKMPKAGKLQRQKMSDDDKLNTKMWSKRNHVCHECNKFLKFEGKPPKWVFSHVHGKGARPDLRLVRENIVFHCLGCHQEWETGGKRSEKMPRTLQLFEKISVKYPDNINGRK